MKTGYDLIKQYVDIGQRIPEYQVEKLDKNLLKTYIRKRLIAEKQNQFKFGLVGYELKYLSKEEIEKSLDEFPERKIMFLTDKDDIFRFVNKYPNSFKYLTNSSEEIQLEAIRNEPNLIRYIVDPSENLQMIAVKSRPNRIRYIHNPTEQVQLEAVKENPFSIEYIKNPTEQVQLEAVKQDGRMLSYIIDKGITPSHDVLYTATKSVVGKNKPYEKEFLDLYKNYTGKDFQMDLNENKMNKIIITESQLLKIIERNKNIIHEDEYGIVETVDNIEFNALNEALYKGRKVTLNKPFLTPDGPKKRAVYVKNDKGNVIKVNFGDPNMRIKVNIPERRKAFRARHNCKNPGPKYRPKFWSCAAW